MVDEKRLLDVVTNVVLDCQELYRTRFPRQDSVLIHAAASNSCRATAGVRCPSRSMSHSVL